MTRDGHLAWAKTRALRYVDDGQLLEAVTSMGCDLSKHPDFATGQATLMYIEVPRGADAVRRWINGFN